jgi:putrescine transport system substrate-binding protein
VAHGYSGDILQARDRAIEAGNGVELAYSVPAEGAVVWTDVMAIPADAPHPDNAHRFIDFLLQPEVIAAITNRVAYANANAAATELIDATIRNDAGIYPPRRRGNG